MSVLHESLMFFASLCILDVLLVSFHHASSSCLRVPVCSSLGLPSDWSRGFSSCYHLKMGKHIAKSSSLTLMKWSPFLPTGCIGSLVTSIISLSRIILEDGVVTKLEWQSETRIVSEEELDTERVVPVSTTESPNVMCMVIQNSVS